MNFLFFYVFFYIIFIDNLNNYYEIALCYNKKTIICCNAAPCQISQFYIVLFRNKSKKKPLPTKAAFNAKILPIR